MLVGLLSDTHDRLPAMVEALRILRGAGARYFLHGGDVGGEQILDCFAGDQAAFVWGNNDFDRERLARYARSLSIQCLDDFGQVTIDGKRFAITHGDDAARVRGVLNDQRHDYLITGHTHVKRDQRVGKIRWINPGALHRASQKTVAILDTANDELRFLNVSI